MKITSIETIQNSKYSNLVWIKIHTDEGLVGLGETFRNPQAIISYLHETCAPYLIGRDPLRINEHSDNLITGHQIDISDIQQDQLNIEVILQLILLFGI